MIDQATFCFHSGFLHLLAVYTYSAKFLTKSEYVHKWRFFTLPVPEKLCDVQYIPLSFFS